MKIVLMGYMGSGKSTVGEALAKHLKYPFQDLDQLIEAEQSSSISSIFEKKGAIFFRVLESKVLKSTLNGNQSIVLSLGGGTPCYANNLDLINEQEECISIYLRASVPFLASRLFQLKDNRPLISKIESKEEMMEFIGKHLFERAEYYMKADHIIDIENKSAQQICEEIILKLF